MSVWPPCREVQALCRLLCRPSPPLVAAAKLQAASSLAELQQNLPGARIAGDHLTALQAGVEAWRRAAHGALLTYYDEAYPALLRHIAHPPLGLFVRGDPRCLGEPTVALVGTRAASAAARDWTRDVAADLGRSGVVVVSGLARGIDAAAHEGAVESGGATVAVLGCGPDLCYPPEHAGLARRIAVRGAVATELPPGTPPRPWHFPLRNRILAGLASGVVVVQAELRSGALITARHALDENREVMAVPGDVGDPRSRGPHQLLRQGATLVDSARDILEALRWLPPAAALDLGEASPAAPSGLRGDHPALLAALGSYGQVEALRARLRWSPERLLRVLSELELSGVVTRATGGVVLRSAPPPS